MRIPTVVPVLFLLVPAALAQAPATGVLESRGAANGGLADPVVADFDATPTSGTNPLAVKFTDASTGINLVAWIWELGDGTLSAEQDPKHTDTAVVTRPYGAGTGMDVWAETDVNELGPKVVRFPFRVPGL